MLPLLTDTFWQADFDAAMDLKTNKQKKNWIDFELYFTSEHLGAYVHLSGLPKAMQIRGGRNRPLLLVYIQEASKLGTSQEQIWDTISERQRRMFRRIEELGIQEGMERLKKQNKRPRPQVSEREKGGTLGMEGSWRPEELMTWRASASFHSPPHLS